MLAITKRCLANEASEKSEIRDIGDDRRIIEMAQRIRQMEGDLKTTIAALSHCTGSSGAGQPAIRYSTADDVTSLLDGTPASTLIAPAAESEWHSLQRQRRALEAAIPTARHRLRTLRTRLEIEEVNRLGPKLKLSYGSFLDAIEASLFHLREHHELLTRMHRAGVGYDSLGVWKLSPREEQMLHGGHEPNLEKYLEIRREATGLDGETE